MNVYACSVRSALLEKSPFTGFSIEFTSLRGTDCEASGAACASSLCPQLAVTVAIVPRHRTKRFLTHSDNTRTTVHNPLRNDYTIQQQSLVTSQIRIPSGSHLRFDILASTTCRRFLKEPTRYGIERSSKHSLQYSIWRRLCCSHPRRHHRHTLKRYDAITRRLAR